MASETRRAVSCLTVIRRVLLCMAFASAAAAQQTTAPFYVTSGRDASAVDGDSLHRAVYRISCPADYDGRLYIRVFDADAGGMFDQETEHTRTRFSLYGSGNLEPSVRAVTDPLAGREPLEDCVLGPDQSYENRWRTIAALLPAAGELRGGERLFELIVDGESGGGANLYKIFISSEDKINSDIPGLTVTADVVTVLTPRSSTLATQFFIDIPQGAASLVIYNFDAEGMGDIFLQTPVRERIPVDLSENGGLAVSRIPLVSGEAGAGAALIISGRRPKSDYVQCWIEDEEGRPLPVVLPPRVAPLNHVPVPLFTALPVSDPNSLLLDGTASRDPDNDPLSWRWSREGKVIGEGARFVCAFPGPGTYDIELAVSDNSGFVASTGRLVKAVTVNQPPVAAWSAGPGIPGKPLRFDGTGSSDSDGRIIRYIWEFGDGGRGEGATVSHTYAQPGRYPVTLQVEDNSESLFNRGRKTAEVWINAQPVPVAAVQPRAAVGETVLFDGGGSMDSDGELISFQWKTGDGTVLEGRRVTHVYSEPGVYDVELTVTDDAGTENSTRSLRKRIIVNRAPVAEGRCMAVAAAHEPVLFDGSASSDGDGSITAFSWDFGDGATGSGKSVDHVFDHPGVYRVVLAVTDDAGVSNSTARDTMRIRINAPPLAVAGDDFVTNERVVSFDGSRSFDSDDGIIAYHWEFGDAASAHGPAVVHEYALPGVYEVVLTVTDGSGSSSAVRSDTMVVTVNHPPVADAGTARTAVPGEPVLFQGDFSNDPDGEIVAWRWRFGEGAVAEGRQVSHTFPAPGTCQVLLAVEDNHSAVDSHTITVRVNHEPVPVFSVPERAAPGEEIVFDAGASTDPDGSIIETVWNFGDGTAETIAAGAVHAYRDPGVYQVTCTVRDDAGVSNSLSRAVKPVWINHAPDARTRGDLLTWSQTVLFDAGGSSDADGDTLVFAWDFGDGYTGRGMRIRHTYRKQGVYSAALTADDGWNLPNSRSVAYTKIHINAPPEAVIDAPSRVNAGERVFFDGVRSFDPDNDLLMYSWDFGDGERADGPSPVHMFTTGGYYRVRLRVTDNTGLPGNTGLAEHVVYVVDAPVARAGSDTTVFANRPVLFDGSGSRGGNRPIKSYSWDFGDGHMGGGIAPTHTFLQPGVYLVRLRIEVPVEGTGAGFSEDELTVTVLPSPVAEFTFASPGAPGQDIRFDGAPSTAGSRKIIGYDWTFGDSLAGSGRQQVHRYAAPGVYTVRLTITTDAESGCNTNSVEHTVTINAPPRAVIETSADSIEHGPFAFVRFDGKTSVDPDGFIQEYLWDFGDGGSGSGIFVRHQYARAGLYRVRLIVRDNSGLANSADTAYSDIEIHDIGTEVIENPAAGMAGESLEFSLNSRGGDSLAGNSPTRHFSDEDADWERPPLPARGRPRGKDRHCFGMNVPVQNQGEPHP
ncbi:PKD domain-containing protein [bacterium]|nr:PKD domain-containing protein [bacterium]